MVAPAPSPGKSDYRTGENSAGNNGVLACEVTRGKSKRCGCSTIGPRTSGIARQTSFKPDPIGKITMTTTHAGPLDKYFYFFMSLLIAVVVVCGFSRTVDQNLIHPALPRPFLLYIHAAVFSGWVVFSGWAPKVVGGRATHGHDTSTKRGDDAVASIPVFRAAETPALGCWMRRIRSLWKADAMDAVASVEPSSMTTKDQPAWVWARTERIASGRNSATL